MKTISILLIISLSISLHSIELTKAEVDKVTLEVYSIIDAFNKGDEKVLTEKSHISIVQLMGGKESFSKVLKQGMQNLRQIGTKYQNIQIGKPTKFYLAGKEEICFVPNKSTLTTKDQKYKSIGYMIAVRKKGTQNWKYIDGAGFQRNKKLLWVLLPKLEKKIVFPPFESKEIK